MDRSKKNRNRLAIGILIGVLCIYLAFRKVEFDQLWKAFGQANYWYLLPAAAAIFLSHFLRAFRWRYLLDPVRRLDTGSLFSALIIGYAANTVMPAHLGEFLRAFVLSKKRQMSMSPVFATVIVERIIDVFSLLVLMVLAVFVHPFPDWVIESGYIMFAGTLGLFVFLIFLKKATSQTLRLIGPVLRLLPKTLERKVEATLERFLAGIVPLRRWHDYITVGFLSVIIWLSYGLVFYSCIHAFDFANAYQLTWSASLILLVITTIAVVVPSSPGYVGTYHYLCQISLGIFGVPAGPALSFAFVVHAANVLPVFLVGLFLAHREGVAIMRSSEETAEIVRPV
jgi:uncharacterized protein (TIRG00374 family)